MAAIQKAGKALVRKQKRSNHRKKTRLALARVHKKTANQRKDFHCPHCGAVHDRDRNAAMNILKVGASTFFGEASQDL